MQIGGWTRIWIVLSGLLLTAISALTYHEAPTREEILFNWYSDAAEVLAKTQIEHASPIAVRLSHFNGSEQENLDLLNKLAEGTRLSSIEMQAINTEYKTELSKLTERQVMHWAKALGFWFLSILLIYLSGKTLNWIWRGFQNSNLKNQT